MKAFAYVTKSSDWIKIQIFFAVMFASFYLANVSDWTHDESDWNGVAVICDIN